MLRLFRRASRLAAPVRFLHGAGIFRRATLRGAPADNARLTLTGIMSDARRAYNPSDARGFSTREG